MALGERIKIKDGAHDKFHEYWYTGQGEMLHMVDGRISKALGFTHEIRSQTQSAPNWSDVVESKNEVSWSRKLDLMPGYRYNLLNNIYTFNIGVPKDSPSFIPNGVRWIADIVESKSLNGHAWWYLQRFALMDGRVVYSEQCIDQGLCIKIRHIGVISPQK